MFNYLRMRRTLHRRWATRRASFAPTGGSRPSLAQESRAILFGKPCLSGMIDVCRFVSTPLVFSDSSLHELDHLQEFQIHNSHMWFCYQTLQSSSHQLPNAKSDSLFEQKHLDVLLFLLEAQAAWELCAIAHPFRRSHAMARNPSIAAESMSWMINETIRRTRELHFPLQSWSATEMHFSVF